MIPAKEKAKELVDKYLRTYPIYDNPRVTISYTTNEAKQCALIAVDEILNNVYRTPFRFTAVSSDELYRINEECKHSLNMNILFLNSVKQEIELL
jgi:hypothetical protein